MSERNADWRRDVLRFWFGLTYDDWWKGSPELDHQISEQFKTTWAALRKYPPATFLGDPLNALAGVILFDQFPRNMFRGHADQFSTDSLALAIAKGAVDRKFDDELEVEERVFLYMPFQHSEQLVDQDRAILLFTALGDANYLAYAKKHRDIIARFGRFPHRNAMLGRAPRPAEIAAGDVNPF